MHEEQKWNQWRRKWCGKDNGKVGMWLTVRIKWTVSICSFIWTLQSVHLITYWSRTIWKGERTLFCSDLGLITSNLQFYFSCKLLVKCSWKLYQFSPLDFHSLLNTILRQISPHCNTRRKSIRGNAQNILKERKMALNVYSRTVEYPMMMKWRAGMKV